MPSNWGCYVVAHGMVSDGVFWAVHHVRRHVWRRKVTAVLGVDLGVQKSEPYLQNGSALYLSYYDMDLQQWPPGACY